MPEETLTVNFCCNDPDNGRATGRVDTIDADGLIRLTGPDLTYRVNVSGPGTLRVGRRLFAHHGYREWVGNWCWDAARLTADELARLVNYLRERGWGCEEAETTLFERWEAGEAITADHLTEAL
jgi:hypothetical protein